MILIAVVLWVLTGWLGAFWFPTLHPSWRGWSLLALWLVSACVLGVLGPIGLWMSINEARTERRLRRE